MLALRYLRTRRKKSIVSVIAGFSLAGIAVGVAALIIVMAVMNGFRKELFDKILGLDGHVIVRPAEGDFTGYAAVADRLKAVPGVVNALPIIEGQVLATSQLGGVSPLRVRGIRGADLKALEGVASKIRFGTLDGFDEGGGLALGIRLASALNAVVGDEITLTSVQTIPTPIGNMPRRKTYPVRAVFESGASEDATVAFMPLAEAQKFFQVPGAAQVMEVLISNPDMVDAVKPGLEQAAGANMVLTDWRQRNATYYNALTIERNAMFVVLGLIVLVAAFNIIAGLIMLVKDKSRDVAILRTMGATRGTVMRVFFITGAGIGIAGASIGLVLGVVICLNLERIRVGLTGISSVFDPLAYFLKQMPARMDPWEVTAVMLMALVLALLATIYPSWQAARLDPVAALRYE
jgi:lipoprotein-releasing system permease protein